MLPLARSLLLAVAVGWLWPLAAEPSAVCGQDDPRFAAALALWLDDDEAEALPALAALAAEGNRAAQMLLALIDANPPVQGPWLVRRPRAERLALLRAPGGLSGRSWMEEAATDTALARLWVERRSSATMPATALAFAAIGEERAARETLQAIAARQFRGFAAIADDPNYPPDLRYMVWREWAEEPGGRARIETEIAALMPGDPQIGRFEHRPVTAAERDAWLAAARLTAPLRATCAVCPQSFAACLRGGWQLIGGHTLLAEFGTLSETLIPSEVWHSSQRGRLALLRLPGTRRQYADTIFAAVGAEDPCLMEALAVETARFWE
jgi:hypothetical protein